MAGTSLQVEFLFGWFTHALSTVWSGVRSSAGWVWSGATSAGDAIGQAAGATWDGAEQLASWVRTGAEYYANTLENYRQRDLIGGYQALLGITNILIGT